MYLTLNDKSSKETLILEGAEGDFDQIYDTKLIFGYDESRSSQYDIKLYLKYLHLSNAISVFLATKIRFLSLKSDPTFPAPLLLPPFQTTARSPLRSVITLTVSFAELLLYRLTLHCFQNFTHPIFP